MAWLTERPEEELALEAPPPACGRRVLLGPVALPAQRADHRLAWLGASIAVSGLVLWGPTFLERILDISSDKAALLFLLVALGSFAGRLFFSFLPQRVGRRTCGLLMGFGAVPPLVLAAFSSDTEVAGVPLFLLALIPAAFFVDGGFANLAPYTPEVFPTSLRTHGMGLAWAVSGLGRIIGPLVIALVAGTGDLVDPEATLDALPAVVPVPGGGRVARRRRVHGREAGTPRARSGNAGGRVGGGGGSPAPAALEQT